MATPQQLLEQVNVGKFIFISTKAGAYAVFVTLENICTVSFDYNVISSRQLFRFCPVHTQVVS